MSERKRELKLCPRRRGAAAVVLAAASVAVSISAARGASISVTANSAVIGSSPQFLGYSEAHYMQGSNTSAWVQYAGLNGYRLWMNASDYEPTNPNYGDGATTLSAFDANKAVVRANPEGNALIPWSTYNSKWNNVKSGRNKVQVQYALSELNKLGVDTLLQVSRTATMTGWTGKWEEWKFYYTAAYWAAKNYDVQRFQMFNEPDLAASSQADWIDRLHVASDAIKSAIEDVNTNFGKQLNWHVYAPVAADQDGTVDTWGKAALESNRTDYAGRPVNYDIFDNYDVHRYNSLGTAFVADQQLFDTKIPAYNPSGQNMPVSYTEFNRYQSSIFNTRPDSPDTPAIAAEFGSIFPGAMSQGVYGMYAFKFGQTLWDADSDSGTPDVPQKTGMHYVEDSGTYGIKGATRSAEVLKLAIKAFKGGRPRLGTSVSTGNVYDATASYDGARDTYYYYATNRDSANTYTTTLDVSSWNVAAGQVIGLQEVSGAQMGAVSQYLTVSAGKTLTWTQPASSVTLLSIPAGTATQTQVNLTPTADAYVSHASPTSNFGAATTAKIDRNDTSTADDATYLKFNLGANARAKVGRAFLNVTGLNTANSTSTIIHAYGILNNAWTETGSGSITWNNAPNLVGASDAKLANVGTDAFPVGELTWNNVSKEWGIDVTDFVRQRADASGNLSFVLIREQRFLGDTDTSVITVNTRENATGKPRLALFNNANGLWAWNANASGTWSTTSNWDVGSAPSGAGSIALLSDFITTPRTVTLGSATTIGELRFDGQNAWTLTGSAALTISGGTSGISVYKGSHKLDVPVTLAGATAVNVEAGATLTVSKTFSGSVVMTKTGAGTLRLSTPQTFGVVGGPALNANGGIVELNSTFSRAISVGAAGTLAGTGTVASFVTSSGKIAPGGVGVAGAPLNLNGGVTLNAGSSIDFDFSSASFDQISSTGNLTLSSTANSVAVNINDLGGLSDGDFTLITHANALANLDALYIGDHPAGMFTFLNNAGAVVLHVTGLGTGLFWRGTTDGTWDVNTTSNFLGGASGKFINGDRVTFDDNATGPTTLTVASGGVSPARMAFNNSTKDYTVGGPGSISGAGDLIKDGTRKLTLTGANNFTGKVQINAGTFSIASGAAVAGASGIELGGVTFEITGTTSVAPLVTVTSSSAVDVKTNTVTLAGGLTGAGGITKLGAGTLVITAPSGGFAGGIDIDEGMVRGVGNDSIGAGPVTINAATLRLDNVSFGTSPTLTLMRDAVLQTTGTTQYSKSNFPAIYNGTSGSHADVTMAALNAGDKLSFGSTLRNTASATSYATIHVNPNGEAGTIELTAGGLSAGNTYSGDWTLGGGFLKLGPNTTSSSEAMNALGFKNSDAKQANAVTITGGTLVGAVNAPLAANAGSTSTFFRAGVTLAGGGIASTTLDANFGGDFSTAVGTTSRVLTYDPYSPATARSVNVVAGLSGAMNNAAGTAWGGTLIVSPGTTTGGAFNINRDGGTLSVTPGAAIQIEQGAALNLGGAADVLNDGVDRVNLLNNSTASGLNVTAGTKNVGNVDGVGNTSVAGGATMIAGRVRQGAVTVNGTLKLRDAGSAASVSSVTSISMGASGLLDLRNNSLIVKGMPIGSWNNTSYTGVQQLVAKGRNGGAQNGMGGIFTTMTSAISPSTRATLAVATAGDAGYSTFAGLPVASSDVLVMYTYTGDGNLDGKIDADDYFRIDRGYSQRSTGYASGDFDYSGSINGDDYFLIDANFAGQGGSLGGFANAPAALEGVSIVPEPGAMLGLAIAGLLSMRRRRM